MSKPKDIPQDVWDAATHWWREGGCSTGTPITYARAIMAERERCERIASSPATFNCFPGDFEGHQIAAAIRAGASVVATEKQIVQVLNAVDSGCETSNEVAAVTGLPKAHCSVYLGNLVDDGLIRLVKHDGRWFEGSGRKSHVYGPINAASHKPEVA